ncbi:peptide deformylase [Endozoicomonas sp. SCSIO W0465]|uniref:peptide deformylase n=1 Tax=Endozoicomonas sp. SCSIO W0465 TaxID=2918516 RepID=UPI0020763845|nr:peptide deformylase [Endozoicomonas sp. SCSIO W0465]USE36688.1 peptide deformylase [Endozoicomonas sp. SCSIO W0465]
MALLEILEYPDPRLRTVAKPVAEVNDDIRRIVDDMLETMYDARGVGLAATQVDIHQRIVVMDLSEEGNKPQVLINPGYEPIGDEKSDLQEGCLSVPGIYELLDRYSQVRLTALDRDGNEYTRDYDGLAAVCVQHELDHLEGKLFIDTLSRLKLDRIKKKLGKRKH